MIIRAFWHRTRKEFVPMTVDDICRKTKASPDKVSASLASLSRNGFAAAIKSNRSGDALTWHLTSAGEARARAALEVSRVAKGPKA